MSPERFFAGYVVSHTGATLASATVGTLIVARRPGNAIGWLCCVIGLASGATALTSHYIRYTKVTEPGSLPAGDLVAWLYFWTWIRSRP